MTYNLVHRIKEKLNFEETITRLEDELKANPVPEYSTDPEKSFINHIRTERIQSINHSLSFLESMQNSVYSSILLNTYSQFEHSLKRSAPYIEIL